MGTLNRNKHFGLIHGIAPYAFIQEGKYFNQAGEEVDKEGRLIEEPKAKTDEKVFVLDSAEFQGEKEVTKKTPPNPPEASPGGTSSGSTKGQAEGGDGYGTRDEVIAKLEELKVPYNPKSRRSQLVELLKGREGA